MWHCVSGRGNWEHFFWCPPCKSDRLVWNIFLWRLESMLCYALVIRTVLLRVRRIGGWLFLSSQGASTNSPVPCYSVEGSSLWSTLSPPGLNRTVDLIISIISYATEAVAQSRTEKGKCSYSPVFKSLFKEIAMYFSIDQWTCFIICHEIVLITKLTLALSAVLDCKWRLVIDRCAASLLNPQMCTAR